MFYFILEIHKYLKCLVVKKTTDWLNYVEIIQTRERNNEDIQEIKLTLKKNLKSNLLCTKEDKELWYKT